MNGKTIRNTLRDRMTRRMANGSDAQAADALQTIRELDAGGDVVVSADRLKGAVYERGESVEHPGTVLTAAEAGALVDGPAPKLYVLHGDDTSDPA
jgi:hypothetical protein